MSEPLLLLDTHVWIWLLNGEARLRNTAALAAIEKAVPLAALRLSAISLWEIGMLEAKGRLSLPMDCLSWTTEALSAPGLSLLPLSAEIAITSSHLPGQFHGDPADRLIVASARAHNATLVTADKGILAYGKQGHVRVLKV